MITVALPNVFESSQQALSFIWEKSLLEGLRVGCISPKSNIVYKNNKRVPLRRYLAQLENQYQYDLIIINLCKEALRKHVYDCLNTNITVLFEGPYYNKKSRTQREYVSKRIINNNKASFYIIPEKYKNKAVNSITYGWSEGAHISASSAETYRDGSLKMQCCVGKEIACFDGTPIFLKEFGITSKLTDIQGILAGAATLLLYGIDLETIDKRQIN